MNTTTVRTDMLHRSTQLLVTAFLSLQCMTTFAAEETSRATVAIVGETDRFNIGQDDFCASRTEIASPTGKHFGIQSGKETFFYIQTKFRTQIATYTCEGDFSFVPSPAQLHLVRYTLDGDQCMLEMFQSEPGGTPKAMAFKQVQSRSCLLK
jgi:hypothetical protein